MTIYFQFPNITESRAHSQSAFESSIHKSHKELEKTTTNIH